LETNTAAEQDQIDSTWAIREGQELAPGYHAWELLSVGKRFEMWAAWSLDRLTPVCVKFPRRDNFTDAALNALRREFVALSACDHPAIPRAFALELDGSLPHLIVEFVEGDPLGDFLHDTGPMGTEDVVFTGLQILAALRHIHDRGFVHHDLKPANIMVRNDRPVVIDFDLALPIGGRRSRTKPRGTHEYMSPEQIRCAPASPSMDLFALGAVLYRAATGTSPFRDPDADRSTAASSPGEQPRRYLQLEDSRVPVAEAAPDLMPSVAAAIEQLLVGDERRRPATAEAAISLLTEAFAPHGEPLWPEWVTNQLHQPAQRAHRSTRVSRTEVIAGDGTALDFCTSMSPTDRSRAAVIVDQRLEHTPAVKALLTPLLGQTPSASAIPVEATNDTLENLHRVADRLTVCNAETVVVIGGGGTHDIARLAAFLSATRSNPVHQLTDPGVAGLIALPSADIQSPELIAIPTTLGTGVEVSPVACFTHAGVKRLVTSAQLQPSTALLDPSMTASLPDTLMEQGLVEALLRYVGPMLAGPSNLPTADDQTLVEAKALAGLIRCQRSEGLTSDQRLAAAIRGANSRQGFALSGRDPFGSKLWYLATALTDLAPFSKIDAHLMLLPTVLQGIVDGDSRLGDVGQLLRVGNHIMHDPASISLRDVDTAAAALIELCGTPGATNSTLPSPDVLAAHAHRVWGDTQPMLGMFTEAELRGFYESVSRSG